MLSVLKCKCIFGYLWTSALVAAILTFILYAFIDPGHVAQLLQLDVELTAFSIKVYLSTFIFFWFTLNASTYLSVYFGQLQRKMEAEEKESLDPSNAQTN